MMEIHPIQTRDVAGVAEVRETIHNHIIAKISYTIHSACLGRALPVHLKTDRQAVLGQELNWDLVAFHGS